jgi:hypothetical protein
MPKAKEAVFLNIPYDPQFTRLYLAYITATSAVGLLPRATLGITGNRRLDRIASLIESCAYSIHDLSRVQLDRNAPRTPRFNMPFELGLAVAWGHAHPQHKWYVFESVGRRLAKSLSDLDGTDPYIHEGTGRDAGSLQCVCESSEATYGSANDEDVSRTAPKLRANLEQRGRSVNVYGTCVFRSLPGGGWFAEQVRGIRLNLYWLAAQGI